MNRRKYKNYKKKLLIELIIIKSNIGINDLIVENIKLQNKKLRNIEIN